MDRQKGPRVSTHCSKGQTDRQTNKDGHLNGLTLRAPVRAKSSDHDGQTLGRLAGTKGLVFIFFNERVVTNYTNNNKILDNIHFGNATLSNLSPFSHHCLYAFYSCHLGAEYN